MPPARFSTRSKPCSRSSAQARALRPPWWQWTTTRRARQPSSSSSARLAAGRAAPAARPRCARARARRARARRAAAAPRRARAPRCSSAAVVSRRISARPFGAACRRSPRSRSAAVSVGCSPQTGHVGSFCTGTRGTPCRSASIWSRRPYSGSPIPVSSLSVSVAWISATRPGSTPSTPPSAQEGTAPGGGGSG